MCFQRRVVGRSLTLIAQATFGVTEFVENPMGVVRVRAHGIATDVSHLAFGRIANYLDVVLEPRQPQQPIVVRWLFLRPNTEPAMVRIKRA